jgi:multidrug efflux pump
MSFTDLFIKRPVVATVVNLIIFIAGYQAIRSINVRQYPRSDLSVITVTTLYYGADADLVRSPVQTGSITCSRRASRGRARSVST